MNFKLLLIAFILFVSISLSFSQNAHFSFSAEVNIASEAKRDFVENGRLFLFFSKNPYVEPRTQTWPNPINQTYIFALNIEHFKENKILNIGNNNQWISTVDWTLDSIPKGTYNFQALWDQDNEESRINAPGNIYSEKIKIEINQPTNIEIVLSRVIDKRKVMDHHLSRTIDIQSDALSEWWGKPIHLKASVLLPHGYDSTKAYPIRYNVAGYGGRYTRINYLLKNTYFMNWWESNEAPQIISVFLDGEGPFGDSYQMDSENSGPYGHALINELIPYIESKYRGTSTPLTRFVDGCSTGGWVSLGLQLYYPESFNGCFSYSPDAIDFEHYQLINIYKDDNAFVNEYGYLRPIMRDIFGEPMLSVKDFIQYENVLGSSNSYLNSGGQFSAHTALYSPKGANNLPKPLFDPAIGAIDHDVAEHWKKYDFKDYARENWEELGPKIQGKLYIWMGDMDNFYLNTGVRGFDDFLKTTTHPTSDAQIVFSPMEGHCSKYSHKKVLLQIQERIEKKQ